MFNRSIATFGLALLLIGCGSTNSTPPERPSGGIDGRVYDGAVSGAGVAAYRYPGGQKGALLGQTNSDASGHYALSFQTTDGPVLIEATGGVYREEASGRDVTLGPDVPLRALFHYANHSPRATVSVTSYTTLAAAVADWLVSQGQPIDAALDQGYVALDTALGLDTRAVMPSDTTDPGNAGTSVTPAHTYGFFQAAISQWTAEAAAVNNVSPHARYTSASFLKLAVQDVRADGLLDGQAGAETLSVGTIPLNAGVYRHELALALLRFAASAANRTGLTAEQLLPIAARWNDSQVAPFGTASVIPIDSAGPTITQLAPAKGSNLRATFAMGARVDDPLGVSAVELYVDGQTIAAGGTLAQPAAQVDSRAYADGEHTIGVRARNLVGGSAQLEQAVVFDNTGPVIANLQPAEGSFVSRNFTASATVTDAHLAQSEFLLDGASIGKQETAGATAITIDTRRYSNGTHTLVLRSTDAAGNTAEATRHLYFLNTLGF